MPKKTLILTLGRANSMPIFAKSIIDNFSPFFDYDVMASRLSDVRYPKNQILIHTYDSKISLILNTFFLLPFYFLRTLLGINRYGVLYLPYVNHWDLPFIMLFRALGKRVILTVHDGILHEGEDGFFRTWTHYLRIRLSTDFIFLTEFVKKTLSRDLRSSKPYCIIPHGLINNDYIKPKLNSGKNLLFFGRIGKYKGVEMLMRAALKIESAFDKLIVAGKSIYPISFIEHEKIEVRDKYLSEEEIGWLFSWADVLVLPYLEATQSGVIPLGISAGLPMVCTDVGGLHEQLAPDECIWVEPDEESLANGMLIALDDERTRKLLKSKMTEKKAELSWSSIAKQTEQFVLDK